MYTEEELNNMSLEELQALEKKLRAEKPKRGRKPKQKVEVKPLKTADKKPTRKKKEIVLEDLVPAVDEAEFVPAEKRKPRLATSHGDEVASKEKLKLGPRPNNFLKMPEAKSKNTDKKFDKKVWKGLEPVERGARVLEDIRTNCAGCGKKITIPASLVVKGTRYKCNKCASIPGSGGESNFGDDDED